MKFQIFLLAAFIALFTPTAVVAVWGTPGPITSHRRCFPCNCLGPLVSGPGDSYFDEFCNAIMSAPCSNHIRSAVSGSFQYISANAPGCNIIWAPTKSQCMQAFGALQAGRDLDMCAAVMEIRNFSGVRMANLAMGGQCIPGPGSFGCPA
ncbi:hypothetical protein EYR40_000974 [Pleurotus pulmonarius]|nr:hypothetical protein EYR36_004703 [Pleurotus pulmonarius]KAF4578872.1 hypothetical protein EYR36_000680 [Pleurotus pulmonarius]KAF4603803.1 hypothetical protein EYR38_004219 [Pleurotus pulmonarius]KAF4608628.1 hypothetical protein EYR40_000974 [Pleurotus pulmonarius]